MLFTMEAHTKTAEREAAERLVWLYREHEQLWNPAHQMYSNQHARELALSSLAAAMGSDWTEQRVRQKLAAIRASYAREKRKRDSMSQHGGPEDVFVSTWWLFNILDDFLGQIRWPKRMKIKQSSSLGEDGSEGLDSNPAEDNADEASFLSDDAAAPNGDLDGLMQQVSTRAAPSEMQSSFLEGSRPASPGPEDCQTLDHSHRGMARQAGRAHVKKRLQRPVGDVSASIARCAATVRQLSAKLLVGLRARDEYDEFGSFIAAYLRRIKNADVRDDAMLEIHTIVRDTVRRQNRQNNSY